MWMRIVRTTNRKRKSLEAGQMSFTRSLCGVTRRENLGENVTLLALVKGGGIKQFNIETGR
jgi:hypothetical protein